MCWWNQIVTRGVDAQNQVARDPRLALREGAWARIVDVPRPATATPLRRPVRVQIDAAPVLTRSARVPVGIEVRHDPQVERRLNVFERACDCDARAFGAVNAADDEHSRPRRIAGVDGHDGTPILRAAEEQRDRAEVTRRRDRHERSAEGEHDAGRDDGEPTMQPELHHRLTVRNWARARSAHRESSKFSIS